MTVKPAATTAFLLVALIVSCCGQAMINSAPPDLTAQAAAKMTGRLKLKVRRLQQEETEPGKIKVLLKVTDAAEGRELPAGAGMTIDPGPGKIVRGTIEIDTLLVLLTDELIISADLAGSLHGQDRRD
jgi:hypothetical protein